jgi:hypothetical protein
MPVFFVYKPVFFLYKNGMGFERYCNGFNLYKG